MRNFSFVLVAGFLVPGAALADTLTETFTCNPLTGYTSEGCGEISQFNPSLGTLDSIELVVTASSTWMGGGPTDVNEALYMFLVGSTRAPVTTIKVGNGTVPGGGLNEVPFDPLLIGTGTALTGVTVFNPTNDRNNLSSTFGTEEVIYTFTPASPVPEPNLVTFVGMIVLGLVLVSGRLRCLSRVGELSFWSGLSR